MPQKLTAKPGWTDAVTVPRDGENVDAADLRNPVQDLLGNTMHLYAQLAQANQTIEELKRDRGGFQLTVPPVLTLEPGRNYTFTNAIQLGRYEGWSGLVTLNALNLPAGVEATFGPNPVDDNDADLTLNVSDQAVAGPYDVTVAGTGADGKADSARMRLEVLPETARADFAFTASATTVSLDRANGISSQALQIHIERTGHFDDDITFGVMNLPAGMTQQWSKSTVTGNQSVDLSATTLTLGVNGTLPAGSYSLDIRASGGGIVRTQAVQVVVGLASDAGFTLRLEYDPGDPYLTNGATLYIDRSGGYAGPVLLKAQDVKYTGIWWWPFDDRMAPMLLINGQPMQANVTGNVAQITADGVSRGWQGAGVAQRQSYGRQVQTILRGEAVVAGKTVQRTTDINIRCGSRMY